MSADPREAWRVVDADTGALVAAVASREEAVLALRDAREGAIYLIEPPAAEAESAA